MCKLNYKDEKGKEGNKVILYIYNSTVIQFTVFYLGIWDQPSCIFIWSNEWSLIYALDVLLNWLIPSIVRQLSRHIFQHVFVCESHLFVYVPIVVIVLPRRYYRKLVDIGPSFGVGETSTVQRKIQCFFQLYGTKTIRV